MTDPRDVFPPDILALLDRSFGSYQEAVASNPCGSGDRLHWVMMPSIPLDAPIDPNGRVERHTMSIRRFDRTDWRWWPDSEVHQQLLLEAYPYLPFPEADTHPVNRVRLEIERHLGRALTEEGSAAFRSTPDPTPNPLYAAWQREAAHTPRTSADVKPTPEQIEAWLSELDKLCANTIAASSADGCKLASILGSLEADGNAKTGRFAARLWQKFRKVELMTPAEYRHIKQQVSAEDAPCAQSQQSALLDFTENHLRLACAASTPAIAIEFAYDALRQWLECHFSRNDSHYVRNMPLHLLEEVQQKGRLFVSFLDREVEAAQMQLMRMELPTRDIRADLAALRSELAADQQHVERVVSGVRSHLDFICRDRRMPFVLFHAAYNESNVSIDCHFRSNRFDYTRRLRWPTVMHAFHNGVLENFLSNEMTVVQVRFVEMERDAQT